MVVLGEKLTRQIVGIADAFPWFAGDGIVAWLAVVVGVRRAIDTFPQRLGAIGDQKIISAYLDLFPTSVNAVGQSDYLDDGTFLAQSFRQLSLRHQHVRIVGGV